MAVYLCIFGQRKGEVLLLLSLVLLSDLSLSPEPFSLHCAS